jgi:hypothetical protein
MPIVPFSYRDPNDLGDSFTPSHTHLMMAAAMMQARAERFKIEDERRQEKALAKESK